jgi:geranyl-CoA carboxylase alpha subunit
MTISTVMVANRGEIAIRVMKTAKRMGMRTVAVYSEADAKAAHVRAADQAVCIGPAPVGSSYLRADLILDAAVSLGVDAVHPGYGFLSENADFAEACAERGIVFIGPSRHAIEVMGDKARAKRAMIEAGVPCVPGYQDDDQSLERLTQAALEIGMPVMVKAAAGGGGRGMRLVHDASDLEPAIAMAQSEAQNAFGSSELIIEKAIIEPRHVEIQVFADQHGNVVHLGERDCSIQRRHQKVVEESPCPVMTESLRQQMGNAAVDAAKAVNYVGAGTVEFLLDKVGDFYFLEMNTRLQVEHPVTELVTGLDLVEWQLRVARGESLPLEQEDIELFGHAIEVRLYAEDPYSGFLPSTGPIRLFELPDLEGFRVDAGVESGDSVSPFYDSMVAKVMAHGETREDARRVLINGLSQGALLGLPNNRDFLLDILKQDAFTKGEATTAFIGQVYGEQPEKPQVQDAAFLVAAVAQYHAARLKAKTQSVSVSSELLDWASTGIAKSLFIYEGEFESITVRINASAQGVYDCSVNDKTYHVDGVRVERNTIVLNVDGRTLRARFVAEDAATIHVAMGDQSLVCTNTAVLPPGANEEVGSGNITAPMHGLILSVEVESGQSVVKGQRLAILEAMKMQHSITAPGDGTVATVAATSGQQVAAGDILIVIEEQDV